MIFLWFSNAFLWFSYCFPMIFLWCSYDFPMIILWFSYDLPMIFLRLSYHFPMVFQCCPMIVFCLSLLLVAFPVSFCQVPFLCSLFVVALPVAFLCFILWLIHATLLFSQLVPMAFRCFPAVFDCCPWVFMVSPMLFCKVPFFLKCSSVHFCDLESLVNRPWPNTPLLPSSKMMEMLEMGWGWSLLI